MSPPPAVADDDDVARRLEEARRRADGLAQALARRESEMRALLDHLPALVYVKDARGAYTMVNESMRKMFGRPYDEIIGRTNHDLLPIHLAAQFDEHDAELLRTGQPQTLEVPTDPDLADRVPGAVYEARKAPVRDAAGRIVGLAGISLDITARQRTRVELAQLYLAEHERRRMAEALRDAGAALNASLDVEAVLDQTITHLGRIAPCDAASLMLIDPQARRVHLARHWSFERAAAEVGAASLWFDLDASPPVQQLADRQAPYIILDRQDLAGYARAGIPPHYQSWIAVPAMAGEQAVAVLSALKTERGFYRPEHSTYLAPFAAQVGLALQNARLYAETTRALEREQFLNEVARAVSGISDFPAMVQTVTQLAADAVGADGASMGLLSLDGQHMTAPHVRGLPDMPDLALQSRGEGLLWRIARSGESVLLDEYTAHPQARPDWSAAGLRAFLGVPILAGEDRVGAMGFFTLSPDRHFTARDLALAESIGRQVGGAVQRARLHEKLQQMAHTDSLTGLHTRRRFFELAQQAFEQAQQRGEPVAVLMLDVDGFKKINDTLGHIAGDQVLQKVAARCRSRLRGTDIIGRYGGDEFAVVLPGADQPHACRVAERLRAGVETAMSLRRPSAVTISLGIAVRDARARTIEALVARADRALYEAKRAGGNRAVGP